MSIKIVALPCICADVFHGNNVVTPGGEALNFAVHASGFENIEVTLLSRLGCDHYADVIMRSLNNFNIDTSFIKSDPRFPTAHNITYLSEDGDRYYLPDSWHGEIQDDIKLDESEISQLRRADVVFIHLWASCLPQVVELKKSADFKLAVDFDICRDFTKMRELAPFVDFFMISGEEILLPKFAKMSTEFDCLFNITLAERGSVTYHHGREYRVDAERISQVVDTTGCGDSYHAGFVCSYMLDGDIEKAMRIGSHLAAKTLSHYGGF